MSSHNIINPQKPTKQAVLDNNELKYWISFSKIYQLNPLRFRKVLKHFSNLEIAWQADATSLVKSGLEDNVAQEIVAQRNDINPDDELAKLEKENINVVTTRDDNYPELLKEIYDYPPLLYYRGSLNCLEGFCLGVVGTRKFTSYGRQTTEEIVGDLARSKVTIVSGLALGIDAIAHWACLNAGGLTVAVIGSGLDWQNIYPSTNRMLAQKIIDGGGCVISEYPIGTMPAKFTFPQRNRLIAGLSWGTLVIEAPERSGALITARHTLEQNRETFAIPGSIYNKNSQGTNNLIKQGAKMVTSASDVLEEFNLQQTMDFTSADKPQPGSPEEEKILNILTREPIHIDKLVKQSNIKINVLSGILSVMEISGVIKDLGGKNYIIK